MSAPRQSNLPTPLVRLVGRDHDLVSIRDLVLGARGHLVTLTGTGGCGKTQLALKVAAELLGAYRDGVWFVDLASLQDPHLVPYAVAAVLGRGGLADQAIEDTLLAYLADREILLVLDNCEHLIDACSSLANRILSGCPWVRLLATSRERLRIGGETTWRVDPLPTPDPQVALAAADLLAYPAVQLFVERAQEVRPDFTLSPANAAVLSAVCARLEGLPLALELAAARLPTLSLPQILERLDDSFRLLVGGLRSAPRRQQTLRATLDWSHRLLSPAEQMLFRRLAVFRGGWTLEAAEAVCSDDVTPGDCVLQLLTQLVDKSLVVVGERDERSRYRLLEPLRQYAAERLGASGEFDAVRQRHAAFFLAFADGLERDINVGGARRGSAALAIEGEYPNLQRALHYALDVANAELGLRLAWTLQFVWKFRLPAGEGRRWIEQLLRLPGAEAPTPARAVALLTAAWLARAPANAGVAPSAYYAEALALARYHNEPWIEFVALADRGTQAKQRGDYLAARASWEEALVVTQSSGDCLSQAILSNNLGQLAINQGDYAEGRAYCQRALHLARELADPWAISLALEALGLAALALGELTTARWLAQECLSLQPHAFGREGALRCLAQVDAAEGHFNAAAERLREALALAQEGGFAAASARVIETVAELAGRRDRADVGVRLAAAAEYGFEACQTAHPPVNIDLRDRWLRPVLDKLGQLEADRLWAAGRALRLEEAVALAKIELQQTTLPGPSTPLVPLTARQREVAALVAHGLTNRQIGERLVITERAAGAHIEHILDRLGIGSRVHIAVWAAERGLLSGRSPTPGAQPR